MIDAAQVAYKNFHQRKDEERIEKSFLNQRKAEEEEELRMKKVVLEKVQKSKDDLDKKEERLAADEKETGSQVQVADNMLAEGSSRLSSAISNKDFVEVQVAQALIESAKCKLASMKQHQEEQMKKRKNIGKKRAKMVHTLVKNAKCYAKLYFHIICISVDIHSRVSF